MVKRVRFNLKQLMKKTTTTATTTKTTTTTTTTTEPRPDASTCPCHYKGVACDANNPQGKGFNLFDYYNI